MLGDVAVAVHPKDARYKKLIGQEVLLPLSGRAIPLVGDEDVDREFGTGAVKVTPAHDPADFKIALKHHLEKIVVIDEQARMTGPIPEKYLGLDRFACRQAVLEDLRAQGLIEKEEEYVHNVGHCQRCETMVEPNISKQWFLKTAELAQPAIARRARATRSPSSPTSGRRSTSTGWRTSRTGASRGSCGGGTASRPSTARTASR